MKILQFTTLMIASTTVILMTGCASTGTSMTTDGVVIGAASGALIGSAVNGTNGALAGAAIGGLAGGAIGYNEEQKARRQYYRDSRGYVYYIGRDGRRHYR